MYVLKVVKNEKGNEVFAKERQGKGFVYLAKSEDGKVGTVTKNWILKHKNEIVNLGISNDSIYPVKVGGVEKAKCDYCGRLHNKNSLTPIYDDNGKKTKKMICRQCVSDRKVCVENDLIQCGDCKRIFEYRDPINLIKDMRCNEPFEVYKTTSCNRDDTTTGHVCSDCVRNGKKYTICTTCDDAYCKRTGDYGCTSTDPIGICIVKKSEMSKRYDCPKACVDMVKDF